jgi:glucan biosynthesis protein C
MERHYGMDWLRIGAFALLILYHIGMVFVPWGFSVKTAHPLVWAEIPMLLTSPWRLTLLFVVSGYASRALLARTGGIGAFLRGRSARLLPPLLFGIAVIVPPQAWVELTTQHGYTASFGHFFVRDYFRFGTIDAIVLPTWNHLWFVVYLWVYTLALGLLLKVPGTRGAQALFDRLFAGRRAILLPALYLLLLEVGLFPHHVEDSHDLVTDGVAHLRYVPAFLFGFGLAGSPGVRATLAAHWRFAGVLAVGSYATIAVLLLAWPDFSFPSAEVTWTYRIARHLETWAAIAALIGIAERYWNRDAAWRAMLAEATFPFYIIHQTAIIVLEYALLQWHVGPLAEFAVLVPGTVASCWVFYLAGRRIGWLRPLIGLGRLATPRASAKAGRDDRSTLDIAGAWRRGHDRARLDAA